MSQIRFTLQHNAISSTLKVGSLNALLPQLSRQQWPSASAWTSGERVNRVIFEYQLHTRTNQKFKVPALTLSLSLSQLGFAPQLDYTASDTIIMAAVLIALPSGSSALLVGESHIHVWHPHNLGTLWSTGLNNTFLSYLFRSFGFHPPYPMNFKF